MTRSSSIDSVSISYISIKPISVLLFHPLVRSTMQFLSPVLVALCATSIAIAAPTQKRQAEICETLSGSVEQARASLEAMKEDWIGTDTV